ncbi:MAG: flagellin, partial [Planctomycetota bacterium]
FTQDAAIGGPISVAQRHNSLAAEQLGLLDGTFDTANNRWIGEDRGAARAESVFTTLLDLERALQADDDFGMQLATEKLKASIDGVAQTRALMGGFAQRARNETARQEDKTVIDQELRAGLQDLDFAEAASRFSLLQTQLEAGLRVTSLGNQLTLLNFL